MSVAERQDALEVVNDWDELDTQEQSSEAQPQETDDRPDPEVTTQDPRPETGTEAPATPVAEAIDQRLARLEAIEQRAAAAEAERARLQKIVDNHEYSAEGRLRIEKQEKDQLLERLASLDAERANADQWITQVAEQRKQQYLAAGDQAGATNVQLALENELLKRQATRDREDREIAQRHTQELQQAQAESARMRAGREVQAAFIPTMQAEAVAAAQQFGLDEAETEDLVAFAAPRSLRALAPNAPPEVLGQLAMEQYSAIVERAQQYQARRVQRNQQSFDTTRETAGNGATRDLDKEWEAADFDEANELLRQGYVPKEKGKRRR
jgi:hypothetical protein